MGWPRGRDGLLVPHQGPTGPGWVGKGPWGPWCAIGQDGDTEGQGVHRWALACSLRNLWLGGQEHLRGHGSCHGRRWHTARVLVSREILMG